MHMSIDLEQQRLRTEIENIQQRIGPPAGYYDLKGKARHAFLTLLRDDKRERLASLTIKAPNH